MLGLNSEKCRDLADFFSTDYTCRKIAKECLINSNNYCENPNECNMFMQSELVENALSLAAFTARALNSRR